MIVREKDLEKFQEFEHFGVLGMKWGRRKAKTQVSNNKTKSTNTTSINNKNTSTKNNSVKSKKVSDDTSVKMSRSDKIKLGASAVLIISGLIAQRKLLNIADKKAEAFVKSWANDTMRAQKMLVK